MKLLLLVLISTIGQHKPCPAGKVPSGGVSSSGAVYEYACRTPEAKKEADTWFRRELCEGEYGMMISGNDYTYEQNAKWVKDADGGHCKITDIWEKKLAGKWVKITEDEYMQATCGERHAYTVDKDGTEHETQVYPKPEWTHCRPAWSHQ